MTAIEGKVTRVGANERGQQPSFKYDAQAPPTKNARRIVREPAPSFADHFPPGRNRQRCRVTNSIYFIELTLARDRR